MSVLRYFLILCAFCLASCHQNEGDGLIPVETFFKNPETSAFRISPDGQHLSFLKSAGGKLNLFVKNTDGDSLIQLTSFADQSVKEYYWAGNSHIVLVVENIPCSNFQMFSVDRKGNEIKEIAIKPTVTKIEFVGSFKYPDRYVLFAMNERTPENTDVYQLDAITGQRKMMAQNPGNFLRWITDDRNNVRLAIGSDGVTETLYYRENENTAFKPVKSCNFRSTLSPIGFSSDKEHHIYALSNMERDKLALVELNCLTGKETSVLYENPQADIFNVAYSKTLNKIVYVNTALHKREAHFLNDTAENIYKKIRKKLKNEVIELVDHDSNESIHILYAYTDKTPGVYYLYNIKQDDLTKIGDVNPAIRQEDMGEMRPIQYQSRDGLTIYGYLTVPAGKEAKNLPLVIIPHYGPYKRDIWGFNPEVQFLASRGYAVLQVNFRGSLGYGKTFFAAGFKQWNSNIQNDITDGVNWLLKEKIANPDKIAVYGYDFGGFSALNQVMLNPELYTCAISYSGFINLFTYIKGMPAYYKPYKKVVDEIIGNPEKDVEYLKQASPIFNAGNIKVPLMIFQGGKDSKVNMTETNQFVKELRKNKQEVMYILEEKESHKISNADVRINFYRNLELFLAKHMQTNK